MASRAFACCHHACHAAGPPQTRDASSCRMGGAVPLAACGAPLGECSDTHCSPCAPQAGPRAPTAHHRCEGKAWLTAPQGSQHPPCRGCPQGAARGRKGDATPPILYASLRCPMPYFATIAPRESSTAACQREKHGSLPPGCTMRGAACPPACTMRGAACPPACCPPHSCTLTRGSHCHCAHTLGCVCVHALT